MAFRRPEKKAGQQGVKLDNGITITEDWFMEWVGYGLAEMNQVLGRHAAFADYCDTHPRVEEDPLD